MKKILTLCLIILFTIGFFNVLEGFSTPTTPKIYVEPNRKVFSTETASVGDTFTINISTSGWEAPGLYSFEFKLYFDPALLQIEDAKYPTGHFFDFTPDKFMVTPVKEQEKGYVLFGGTLLGEVGATGSGTFAQVTLKIIKAPPPALSCKLELKDIAFLNPDGEEITEYEVQHGYYEFSAPKPPVYLKVEPASVSAAKLDDEVTLSVTINKMQSDLRLTNVTFKLSYNTTLLSTSKEWVTPGATYPYFNATVEEDYVKVEVQMATQAPFPSGKATLATIKFKAIYVPPALVTSPLTLSDVVLTDIDGKTVEFDHLEDGEYKVPVPVIVNIYDLNSDGKVNIEDIYEFAKAFGSYPGHPRWDPRVDINNDGKINVVDAVLIAIHFTA